jgi:hypothetical protein
MYKTMTFTRSIFAALLLLLPLLAQAVSPVAMISDRKGNVSLHGDGNLQVLSEVNAGDIINIEQGAILVVVYYKTGIEYTLNGPAVVRIGDAAPETVNGNPPAQRKTDYDKGLKPIGAETYGLAQAALAMRGGPSKTLNPEPINLTDTTIVESHPTFHWHQYQNETTYHLELTDATGLTILDTDIKGTSYKLPANIKLRDDEDYFWYLSVRIKGKKFQGHGNFITATAALRQEYNQRLPKAGASFSDRVMFATWLESQRLNDAAKKVWAALAKERPNVTALQEKLK